MSWWFKVLVGFLLIGGVLVAWYRVMRSMRGGSGSGLDMTVGKTGKKRAGDAGDNELERIIALHRSGVAVADTTSATTTRTAAAAGNLPVPALRAGAGDAPARPVPAALLQAPVLLSGAGKLAFLAFKAALPDHHVFARVALGQLVPQEASGPALARHAHAVVVCRSDFSVRAVVDLSDPAAAPRLAEVHRTLEAHAIHHLVVDPRKMPKPGEIRALLHA